MTCNLRPYNGISVISGRWLGDFEVLISMKPRLRLERFRSSGCSNPGIPDPKGGD